MEGRIWLINHNASADLYTPIYPLRRVRHQESWENKRKRGNFGFLFLSTSAKDLSDSKISNLQNKEQVKGTVTKFVKIQTTVTATELSE